MARIKDTSVEAVKSAAEILPLVEDYVRLRKAGGTYKGLCPFHSERTPSFTVTPARGTFKCFGCGEGGDAITFVTKMEQTDFVGAIESLAKRFGVEIEYEEISPEAEQARQRKDRLTKLLGFLAAHYPMEGWSRFLADDKPKWSQIALSGHSQGGGEAAMLAKLRVVARVVLFSSVVDRVGTQAAPWVATHVTPAAL